MKQALAKLSAHPGFRRYLGNTSWLFAEKILRLVISMFITVWMARYLGSEKFGLFNYVLSVVGLLTALATLGLDNVVVKELVKKSYTEFKIINTAFCLKLLSGLSIYIFLGVIFLNAENEEKRLLFLLIGALNIFKSFSVIDFYFQSKVASRYVVKASVLAVILSNSLKAYFILENFDVVAFGLAVLIEHAIIAVGLFYYYHGSGHRLTIRGFDFGCAKHLMKSAWPLVLTAFAASFYMKIDQVMIGELLGNVEVGHYAAAVRLSEAVYFIPIIITASLFPALIEAKRRDQLLYLSRIENLYRLVVYLAIFISLPLSLFADSIVSLLYGEEYGVSGQLLKVHVWGAVFVFMNAAFAKFLYTESLEKKYLYRTIFGAVVNIALNYFFIDRYGAIGAAYATVISMASMNYVYDIFDRDLRPYIYLKFKCFLPILPKRI